ncbi:TetR/AcrR family transcriptional regulator [Streptomyces sp. NBC_01005]|uniref:TetR/AcrR family transcriptional regulator n=1 Tax=unclassified Streptomyces TaxID=2593676 RepID=UPI002E34D34C|nr:TetR/AcrR family transcriptional regulator [Streptomyces sp. NBC_01362]WSW10877.1 TetR/AcrR family transcriptional regulator [Streptomyces sp. NBC_01005]WTC99614.1 TetR/AcrR family transcriptional regulator [Streptomyces sp. NBC_01650]
MKEPGPEATGARTRSRTRRAILSAAASVLGRDYHATLTDIADAAGVGRTTLHRYFSDRTGLISAAIEDSIAAIDESVAGAAIDQGSPIEAMRRLVTAMVAVGDRLVFLFGDPRVLEGCGAAKTPEPLDDPVLTLIKRGQAEGAFDPDVNPAWIQRVLWSLVYTGYQDAEACGLPRHGIVSTVIRTLENGIHTSNPEHRQA